MKFKDLFKNDEDYNKVKEVLGDKIETFETEFDKKELSMIPYSRFKEVNDKKTENDLALAELNKKLDKLSKSSITTEEFETKKNELISEYQTKVNESEKKYTELRKEYAVKDALATAKAKHPSLLTKELDMSKITEVDGKFVGIDEQLTTLKTTYADLFESADNQNTNNSIFNQENNTNIYDGIKSQPLNNGSGSIADIFNDALWGGNPPQGNTNK